MKKLLFPISLIFLCLLAFGVSPPMQFNPATTNVPVGGIYNYRAMAISNVNLVDLPYLVAGSNITFTPVSGPTGISNIISSTGGSGGSGTSGATNSQVLTGIPVGNGVGFTNLNGIPAVIPARFGILGSNDTWLIQQAFDFIQTNNIYKICYLNNSDYTITNTVFLRPNTLDPFDIGRKYSVVGPGRLLAGNITNGVAVSGMPNSALGEVLSNIEFSHVTIQGPGVIHSAGTAVNSIGLYLGNQPNFVGGNIGGYALSVHDCQIMGFKHGISVTNIVGCHFVNNLVDDNWGSSFRIARVDSTTIEGGFYSGSLFGNTSWTNSICVETFFDANNQSGLGLTILRGEWSVGRGFIYNHCALPMNIVGGTYEKSWSTNFIRTVGSARIQFDESGGVFNFTPQVGSVLFYTENSDTINRFEVKSALNSSPNYYIFGQPNGLNTSGPRFDGGNQLMNNLISGSTAQYIPPAQGVHTIADKLWVNVFDADADALALPDLYTLVYDPLSATKLIQRNGTLAGGNAGNTLTWQSLATGLGSFKGIAFQGSYFIFDVGPVLAYNGLSVLGGGITNTGAYYGGDGHFDSVTATNLIDSTNFFAYRGSTNLSGLSSVIGMDSSGTNVWSFPTSELSSGGGLTNPVTGSGAVVESNKPTIFQPILISPLLAGNAVTSSVPFRFDANIGVGWARGSSIIESVNAGVSTNLQFSVGAGSNVMTIDPLGNVTFIGASAFSSLSVGTLSATTIAGLASTTFTNAAGNIFLDKNATNDQWSAVITMSNLQAVANINSTNTASLVRSNNAGVVALTNLSNTISGTFSFASATVGTLGTPSASSYSQIFCTDAVTANGTGSMVYYDGTNWRNVGDNVITTSSLTNYVLNCWKQMFNTVTPISTIVAIRDIVYPSYDGMRSYFTSGNSGGNWFVSSTGFGNSSVSYLSTSTSANAYYDWWGPSEPALASGELLASGGAHYFSSACTAAQKYWAYVGISSAQGNTVPISGQSSVIFLYDMFNATGHGQTGVMTNHWIAVCNKAGTAAYFDTGLTPSISSSAPDRLAVIATSSALQFYTNGVLSAQTTTSANIPAAAMYVFHTALVKTNGTTEVDMYREYPFMHMRRTGPTLP